MSASVRPVGPGSLIDIVAPSGPFDVDGFRAGLDWLSSQGFRVRHRDDIFSRDGFLAGDDERRTRELSDALSANDSDLIWAARGGYGATRIVEAIDPSLVRKAGKLLVGFSDLTALHLAWHKAGVPSIHGAMVARLSREQDESRARLLDLLSTGRQAPMTCRSLVAGVAEGVLTGGNLALLAASCGTALQPDLRGCVVFIEDVGERPYRLDRMLVQCRQAGLFRGIAALVLGDFTNCEELDHTSSSAAVLNAHARALGVPAIAGLCCGHGETNHPLPFGRKVRVDAVRGVIAFDDPLFGTRSAAS